MLAGVDGAPSPPLHARRRPGRLRVSATSLFREHDFRQLWVGDTVSQFGTQVSLLAIPVIAVRTLGADARQMGVLTALETVAFLVVGLPAGAWVDRWRRQRVLVGGDLVRAVALACVPVAWVSGVLSLGLLYAVALVVGVATVFFDVAYQSYLPSIVATDKVVEGNAKLQASASVAQVGGPAVAGLLLKVLAAPVIVTLDAISFLASALFVRRIRHLETPPAKAARRPLRVEIGEGLVFVLRHPLLSRIAACTSLSNLFVSMTFALFVLLMLRDLHQGTTALGLAYSAQAVGGLVGALMTERLAQRVGQGRIIALTAVAASPLLAVVPLAAHLADTIPPLPLIAVGGFGMLFLQVVYNVTQVSFRQRLCPPALLGRMNASIRFLVWGTLPIGGLAGGLLGQKIGILPTMWISVGGLFLASLPVVLSPLLTMRDLPSQYRTSDVG